MNSRTFTSRNSAQVAKAVARYKSDLSGATALEYALIASAIAGVIVFAVFALGGDVRDHLFQVIADAINGAMS